MALYKKLVGAAVLTALAYSVGFSEDKADTTKQESKELKPQTVCPVMGKPIDSSAFIDIQGQRVYFCCPGCEKKLKADPDKYFKKAADNNVLFENIQTRCPVSGEEIDKTQYVDWNGRRIYFCCKKCVASFTKQPKLYLSNLDKPSDSGSGERSESPESESHDGHNHH